MKLSLITVTFNSELTLRDTLRSVLSQTLSDIEYIIIDGQSIDNTIQMLKEYEPRFVGRMRWISEKDTSLYDAMNKGIRMATGDVVGIINSDDFYHRSDILERVMHAFKDESVQAVFGDVRFVSRRRLDKTVRYYSSKSFSPELFRYGFMPAHPTFFTYKKYFDLFGYYKSGYKIAADFELLVRFLYVHRLKYEYMPMDFMRMRLGGVSTVSIRSNITINKEIVRACKENGIWTCFPLVLMKYFVKVFEYIVIPQENNTICRK